MFVPVSCRVVVMFVPVSCRRNVCSGVVSCRRYVCSGFNFTCQRYLMQCSRQHTQHTSLSAVACRTNVVEFTSVLLLQTAV